MKRIRIGNDIVVTWSIYKGGKPYALDGVEIALYLSHAFGKTKIESFQTNSNKIVWTFLGKEQEHTGDYSLILVINENKEGMATTDKIDFVRLTPVTPCCGDDDEDNVTTQTVELTSSMEFAPTVINTGGGGSSEGGLKYSVERTFYPTKIDNQELEITDEERAYNIETYHNEDAFISMAGVFLLPAYGDAGVPIPYRAFGSTYVDYDGLLYGNQLLLYENGDAEVRYMLLSAGGSVDTELFEGYLPMMREFSDDFNNDFSR